MRSEAQVPSEHLQLYRIAQGELLSKAPNTPACAPDPPCGAKQNLVVLYSWRYLSVVPSMNTMSLVLTLLLFIAWTSICAMACRTPPLQAGQRA